MPHVILVIDIFKQIDYSTVFCFLLNNHLTIITCKYNISVNVHVQCGLIFCNRCIQLFIFFILLTKKLMTNHTMCDKISKYKINKKYTTDKEKIIRYQ